MFFCIIFWGDILKRTLNENVLEKAINYLKYAYNNFKFDKTLRSKYLSEFLTKYIRTIESIKILDLKGYQKECDILIRALAEMLIDIAYLELDPTFNYEKYDLYAEGLIYKILKEQYDYDKKDIMTLNGIDKYKNKYDEYVNRYGNFKDRWSGLDYKSEALQIDKNSNNLVMSFELLYMKIYKMNLLYSHNSPLVLNNIYSKLDLKANPDYFYFHNINYIVILTAMLHFILPDIFKDDPMFAYEFDTFLGCLKLFDKINNI